MDLISKILMGIVILLMLIADFFCVLVWHSLLFTQFRERNPRMNDPEKVVDFYLFMTMGTLLLIGLNYAMYKLIIKKDV